MMTEIAEYLSSDGNTPFFVVTGDKNYGEIKSELSARNITFVRTSDFCDDNDKPPDLDRLFQFIKTIDINKSGKDVAIIGLGEYLALRGEQIAYNKLFELIDLKISTAKVVLLLRGVTEIIKNIQKDDLRFTSRSVEYTDDITTNISVSFIPSHIELPALNGIKTLLQALENGTVTDIIVKSVIKFDASLIQVYMLSNAYKAVKHRFPSLALEESVLLDEQWNELLQNPELLSEEQDIPTIDYRDWRCFFRLKNKGSRNNDYMQYVLECTDVFSNFKKNVLNAIINVSHTDKRFDKFYSERKALIEKFTEYEIAAFVAENRKNTSESIYKLTDQTKAECEEIISLFSIGDKQILLKQIEIAYPALYDYLCVYTFNCGELSELLTNYFDEYKWQKVLNKINDDFVYKVETLANERKYFLLPSHNEKIGSIDRNNTYMYWLDALGVEYLGLIQAKCKQLGLSLTVHIVRAELPTITSINKDFYNNWQGDKDKNEYLDEVKHKQKSGYDYLKNNLPIHLVRELEIISEVLNDAATKLALHNYRKILIVSDHGASRLAVIKEQDEKYDTDTKGEHGGRCCKTFSPYDLPFAAEENGYLILANYGRFKGSRKSNVEVHGGASLEEVVVPIIELTLANPDTNIEFMSSTVTASFRKDAELNLFSKSKLGNVMLVISGKRYYAIKDDDNHWTVITDIKRSGEYIADIFDGDNLIGKLIFIVQNEGGTEDDTFDALFRRL